MYSDSRVLGYCCSGRYIKENDDNSTSDGVKDDGVEDDGGLENKDGEDTIYADDDVVVKSKHKIITDCTDSSKPAGNMVKPDDDDDDLIKQKIKGEELYRKRSKNQHFWEIWRRYSEFELLRNFLQTVYPHVS